MPVSTAKTVALNFLHSSIASAPTYIADVTLIGSANITDATNTTVPAYYIFAGANNKGFIIVSADDVVTPILGYSAEGHIDIANQPPAFEKWMESNKNQIGYIIENKLLATEEISDAWHNMYNNIFPGSRSPQAVNPLCQTQWGQMPYVNILCPYDAANTTNQHCVTGCPATAMAQIMKYWNYPSQGAGIHSYTHPTYGNLSANFGSTTYNWGSMPNVVTSNNNDIALLMYHCGVSVEMNYGANSSGSFIIMGYSPTPEQSSEYAYKTYFGYNPATLQGLFRSSYTDPNWINLLKTDLNAGQPIQYAGFGAGGHTFVCDGYDAMDNFHMNWGWEGAYDGYFAINALNPSGVGTGGGAGSYNSNQQAVIGIHPLTTTPVGNSLALYSAISVTPNPVPFYGSFTANVDIINNSTSTFNGDYTAALFNSNYDFVDYIQTYTGNTLNAGFHYTGGINFTTTGILTVPGNYYVGIFYKEATGNWVLIDNGSYSNLVPITISGPVNANNLETYTAITPSPTDFVQGQAASVDVNIANFGANTYFGTYSVDLYDLTGAFVETVGTYTETAGLPTLSAYTVPLTFSSASITSAPGTYYLAVSEFASGGSAWSLTGGTSQTNPVTVNIVAAGLQPDIYEPNNTQGAAYALPLTFSGNTATVNTTGSNNHTGTDNDFYKLNLSSGYAYQITARAQDSYNSNDGNSYTTDVLWLYDTGAGFSNSYDDVMSGTINVNGASTVTFQIAPYFAGNTGTYRFDISLTRSPNVGMDDQIDLNQIHFYPNPSSDKVSFDLLCPDCKVNNIAIYNNLGQLIKTETLCINNTIDVSSFNEGVYFITVSTNKGDFKSKINVVK